MEILIWAEVICIGKVCFKKVVHLQFCIAAVTQITPEAAVDVILEERADPGWRLVSTKAALLIPSLSRREKI